MTTATKIRLFSLFAILSLLVAILIMTLTSTQTAQAGFVQNESNYWNMGNLTLPSNGQGNIEHCTLESSTLKSPNNTVGFNVYTPPGYSESSDTYPVIYLLHGLNGQEYNYFSYFSNSTFFNNGSGSLPGFIDNGLAEDAIIVFVNGGAQSFYNDWSDSTTYGPSSDFPIQSESVIMNEVIPFIDNTFRTVPNRNGRAIEGFSMGGRGAVKLAFNHPDQFCSAISYAGAAYESIPSSAIGNPYIGPHETNNQISTIANSNVANILANGLQVRLVDGENDGAAGQGGGSPALSSQLTSLGISHEFVASQSGVNGHNWQQYHLATGAYGLDYHFSCFAAARTSPQPAIILGASDEFTYLPLVIKPAPTPMPTPSPTSTPIGNPPPGVCN